MTGAQLFNAFLDELSAGAGNKSLMVMIAGPNGAGKTTLWQQLLKPMLEDAVEAVYINADEIERELSEAAQCNPNAPQTRVTALQAQSEATRQREFLLSASAGTQRHFVFETVFSDPYGHKLAELRRGIAAGYYVVMLFVGLDDVELAQQRILQRVTIGGHDVSSDVQHKRFPRVFANAQKALQIVPLAVFFDNSRDRADGQRSHRPVAIVKNGALLAQHDTMPAWWPMIIP
ncbi:zeta toxin family protein [Ralstonia solanacearum P673]|uniref:zeta toxin family protein n=1 Tax=Ralstonia solanacearum TaxID=305 RepID=UPI00202A9890|nr:zeta toxin family protein [Ralstonia solanacearum]MCL9847600.1 zeta toxin family protein [Ralstonia solanacearum]MCL9853638.1 zeta toxin family protein [Ralstonia solanacearum]MCL9861468.1 zeta toxin family protein [Ralstonia solanacearum]MCL9863640.1 zeta toxin family protein [Ralstonia solanacearum]MCL9868084.1 zeta toxin family protein [Ralstonia solanacearum]